MNNAPRWPVAGMLLALLPACGGQDVKELAERSLEELLNIPVTSAARKPQSLRTTAASVFVITSDDIRHSGLHTLPEVLRLAPGVQVARIETGTWGVSIRGFNQDFANKLLVLVNGRSVYNEMWSGVFWSLQEMPLDNIDRIEVIRGPGAALWGVNAVNGVINIITRPASETQGVLLATEAGTEMETNNRVRYGGRIGSQASYRVGIRESSHQPYSALTGLASAHGWSTGSADFRLDWDVSSRDSLVFSGQGFRAEQGHAFRLPSPSNPFPLPLDVREDSWTGDLMGRWRHGFADGSSMEARLFWSHVEYGDANVPLNYTDFGFEFEHHRSLGSRNDLVWGVNYREGKYHIDPHQTFRFDPPENDADILTVVAEDEITLLRDRLFLILGSQTGRHYATGFEVQPTARLLWTPSKASTTWAAVSRAVRTPSLGERGFTGTVASFPLQPPLFGLLQVTGTPGVRSETMLAYEAGQRLEPTRALGLDFSAFYNVHQHIINRAAGAPFIVPPHGGDPAYALTPVRYENAQQGVSYGLELSASWTPVRAWRLAGGYSWLRIQTRSYPGINLPDSLNTGYTSPQHQWQLRSHLGLTHTLELNTLIYFYGVVPAIGIPRYLRGDLNLNWRPKEHIELSAGVQNSLDPSHPEFFSVRLQESLSVPRNVFGGLTWRF